MCRPAVPVSRVVDVREDENAPRPDTSLFPPAVCMVAGGTLTPSERNDTAD